MHSNSLLTPQQERQIAGLIDELRRVALPNLRMARQLGYPDEELELHCQERIAACEGALELNELSKKGLVE